jgi:hypothetical protein
LCRRADRQPPCPSRPLVSSTQSGGPGPGRTPGGVTVTVTTGTTAIYTTYDYHHHDHHTPHLLKQLVPHQLVHGVAEVGGRVAQSEHLEQPVEGLALDESLGGHRC